MLSNSQDFMNSSQRNAFEKNTESLAKNFQGNQEKISNICKDDSIRLGNYINMYASPKTIEKKIKPELEYLRSSSKSDSKIIKEATTYLEEKKGDISRQETVFSRIVNIIHKDMGKKDRKSEAYLKDKSEALAWIKDSSLEQKRTVEDNESILDKATEEKKKLLEFGVLAKEDGLTPLYSPEKGESSSSGGKGGVTSSGTIGATGSDGASDAGSLLDDYADLSAEFPDYTSGDD